MDLRSVIDSILGFEIYKLVISNPLSKDCAYKKIDINKIGDCFQISKYYDKKVFHENIGEEQLKNFLYDCLSTSHKQFNAWDCENEYIILCHNGKIKYKKKQAAEQKALSLEHNRKKNYIIGEGSIVEPLIDMGIFTKEGKIINAKFDKFKQINRFLEIIDDTIKTYNKSEINIIDFGCGKSYLTFIVYYYFTEIKKINVNMVGLDLKADVIEKCNSIAEKYAYKNLRFIKSDIASFCAPFDVDMVLTLHACDTATDMALFNAVKWQAKLIFSVPCCQHELNEQISSEEFKILTRYGIIKERFSSLMTDAIRGNLLTYCGYNTQLMEFVDFENTPKNLLIRAVRRTNISEKKKNECLSEIKSIMNEFNVYPYFYKLLFEDNV